MKIVVVGCGKIGTAIIGSLVAEQTISVFPVRYIQIQVLEFMIKMGFAGICQPGEEKCLF